LLFCAIDGKIINLNLAKYFVIILHLNTSDNTTFK